MHRLFTGIFLSVLISSVSFALTIEEAIESALKNNYQILVAQHQAESAKFNAETAKTPYLPQVNAEYSYLSSSEKAYGIEDEYSEANITVAYNLFNGFSDKYNLEAAKSAYTAQRYKTEAVKHDIALSVKKTYIDVLAALDNLTVAENAAQLLENQLKDIQLSYDVGYVAKNEVLKIEAEYASNIQKVLSAKSSFRQAVFNLEQLTNLELPPDEQFAVLPDSIEPLEDIEALKKEMFENRSEIKYIKELIKSKQYEIKAVKGGYLPKLNIGAGYYSYGEDITPSDREYAYDSETVLNVTASINIFDGLNKHYTAKSLASDKIYMMHSLNDTKSGMVLQLKNAIENFELASASLEAAKSELASAKENYRITQNQFKQKVATNTELMDARVFLTRAENTFNTARFNIHRAMADVKRIIETEL